MPKSLSSFKIKIHSTESAHRYLYEVLDKGGFSIGNDNSNKVPIWQIPIPKDIIYKDYISWCQRDGER